MAISPTSAFAQIDPLAFLKTYAAPGSAKMFPAAPNVVFVVDTSNRMQRDAATDPTNVSTATATSAYYDPFIYTRTGAPYEVPLGVTALNTTATYRRKYENLSFATSGTGDKFNGTKISVVVDKDSAYARFGAPARLAIARAAMYQAITENKNVAQFGLVQMRQKNPVMPTTAGNSGPVANADAGQQTPTDTTPTSLNGRWLITRPTVDTGSSGNNGAQAAFPAQWDPKLGIHVT